VDVLFIDLALLGYAEEVVLDSECGMSVDVGRGRRRSYRGGWRMDFGKSLCKISISG